MREKEGIEGVTNLPEDLETVTRMVHFMYFSTYTPKENDNSFDDDGLLQAQISTYIIAEKYDIAALKNEAYRRVKYLLGTKKAFATNSSELMIIFKRTGFAVANLPKDEPLVRYLSEIMAARMVSLHLEQGLSRNEDTGKEGTQIRLTKTTEILEIVAENTGIVHYFVKGMKTIYYTKILEQETRAINDSVEVTKLETVLSMLGAFLLHDRNVLQPKIYHCGTCEDDRQFSFQSCPGIPRFDLFCATCRSGRFRTEILGI